MLRVKPVTVKGKGKVHPTTGDKSSEEAIVQLYFFFNLGAGRGGWLTPRPGRFAPGKQTRYPLYRRLGGLLGRSGRVRKISHPPGVDSRTVQPVASRYTD